jgi:hypothetical protein
MLNSKAVKKEFILKPPTILEHNRIKIALITSRNKPKVNTVTGSVNKIRIGFTKTFNNPKTIATIIEVVKFSTSTPFITLERNITNIAVKTIFINSFMIFNFININLVNN